MGRYIEVYIDDDEFESNLSDAEILKKALNIIECALRSPSYQDDKIVSLISKIKAEILSDYPPSKAAKLDLNVRIPQ